MINRVVLVGRLTKDVEVKKTQTGIDVTQFTLACDRQKGKDGEKNADFITCQAWRQAATFLGQYAKKGAIVGVDGRIQTRNFDDKDGKKVYVTEVVAENVRIIGQQKTQATETPVAEEVDLDTGVELDITSDDMPF